MKRSAIIMVVLLILTLALMASCAGKGQGDESEAKYFKVTFNSNGGSAVDFATVIEGGTVSEPAIPSRDGWVFCGWFDEKGKAWSFSTDNVSSDITLTAKWLESTAVFDYELVEGMDGCVLITKLKAECYSTVIVPETISGLSVVGIGEQAFIEAGSYNVKKIILPEAVTIVGKNAFKDCSEIKIDVKGKLTRVDEGAFFGCAGLEEVGFGEGLIQIGVQAFSGCTGIESIAFPSSLENIEENAFENCSSLVYVVLHENTKISNGAFIDCSSLVTVFYNGDAESFGEIFAEENDDHGNEKIKNAKLYLYSEEEPSADGSYWYFDDKGRIKIWK